MSAQSTQKLYDDMDLNLFVCDNLQECDQECDDPIAGCMVLQRLVLMVIYYGRLDVQNNADTQAIFIAFINEVYKNILDDYAHLVNEHKNLETINDTLKAQKLFGKCDPAKCSFALRHRSHRIMRTKVSKNSMDPIVHFYAKLVDSLHFYFIHLFDYGLRTEKASPNDTDDDQKEDRYFDKEFERVSKMVNERQHVGSTHSTPPLSRFAVGLDDKTTDRRPRATDLHNSGFNIGLSFYYWPEYETIDEFEGNTSQYNVNDHNGYKIGDLFVAQRHGSFKEESMCYQFITMAAFEMTMTKVKAYMATKGVKALKAWNEGDVDMCIVLKYGIKHGQPLLPRHLLALLFYTDFTELCTHFSATFRATKQFEQLSSIKERNSHYWWMAKSLRETVELYGERYDLYGDDG
eukprot:98196_1